MMWVSRELLDWEVIWIYFQFQHGQQEQRFVKKKVTEAENLRKRVTCIIRYFATQTRAIVLHSITFFAQN